MMKKSPKEKFRFGLGAEFFAMKSQKKRKPRIVKSLKLVHQCNYNARTYTLCFDEGPEIHITASMISVYRKGDKLQIVAVKPFSMIEGLCLAMKNGLGMMHRDTLVMRKYAESVTIEPHSEVNAFFKGEPLFIGKVELAKAKEGLIWTSL